MSATINEMDLHQLGLSGRRTLTIDVPSDIPVENRPVYFDPVVSMTYGREREAIRDLSSWMEWALREAWKNERGGPPCRGVIHLPYRLGQMLWDAAGPELRRRGRYFTPTTRPAILREFLEMNRRDEVLIAAGCSEGLDLRDDIARFQVVGDAPVASLADPAVRYLHEVSPERAEWESVRTLAQTLGRVSRHPGDFGETVIVDSACERILRSEQMPQWAKESYR